MTELLIFPLFRLIGRFDGSRDVATCKAWNRQSGYMTCGKQETLCYSHRESTLNVLIAGLLVFLREIRDLQSDIGLISQLATLVNLRQTSANIGNQPVRDESFCHNPFARQTWREGRHADVHCSNVFPVLMWAFNITIGRAN